MSIKAGTYRGVHTVTLQVRVNSATPDEAAQKVERLFPERSWPRKSVEVTNIRKGWHSA